MFKNEAQMCEALSLLLKPIRLDRLWNKHGPTPEAGQRREVGGSPGERIMVRAAWDLWNGSGNVRLPEILNTLDSTNLQALATLVLAVDLGSEFVELWIRRRAHDEPGSPDVASIAMDSGGSAVRELLMVTVERDQLRRRVEQLERGTETA